MPSGQAALFAETSPRGDAKLAVRVPSAFERALTRFPPMLAVEPSSAKLAMLASAADAGCASASAECDS
jgi:hypothetical protein